MRRTVGIIGNILTMESGLMPGLERAYVNDDYIRAVEKAGGIPIVLPVIGEYENIKKQIDHCEAIIISGGQDIHPMFYNEEPNQKLGLVYSKVDQYQIDLTKLALEDNKPILGICRGHQVLNVACGGTLYQDLSVINDNILKHSQQGKRYDYSHKVNIKEGSILRNLLGEEKLVNSFHHQCIKDLGRGLKVSAVASDGVIEAVEMEGKDFVVGVQWHPEMMVTESDDMLIIFKELIKHCK